MHNRSNHVPNERSFSPSHKYQYLVFDLFPHALLTEKDFPCSARCLSHHRLPGYCTIRVQINFQVSIQYSKTSTTYSRRIEKNVSLVLYTCHLSALTIVFNNWDIGTLINVLAGAIDDCTIWVVISHKQEEMMTYSSSRRKLSKSSFRGIRLAPVLPSVSLWDTRSAVCARNSSCTSQSQTTANVVCFSKTILGSGVVVAKLQIRSGTELAIKHVRASYDLSHSSSRRGYTRYKASLWRSQHPKGKCR